MRLFWLTLAVLTIGGGGMAATSNDETLWSLRPRTPWVGECREIIPLTGPKGPDWKATFAKRQQGEYLRMAATTKVYRMTDGAIDESNAKWYPVRLPQVRYTPLGEPGTPHWVLNKFNAAYYETSFSLSPQQVQKNVLLNFEYIGVHYRIWVNGNLAIYNPQSSGQFESHDISAFVKEGENRLRIMVAAGWGEDDSWVDWVTDDNPIGILRPLYLELRNKVAIERVVVRTALTPKKEMTVLVSVTNMSARAFSGKIMAGGKGDAVEPPEFSAKVSLAPGEGRTISLMRPWPEAELWDPATPRLYRLSTVFCDENRTVDQYMVRFGYRELRWKGTDHRAILNGHPFIMTRSSYSDFTWDSAGNREAFAILRERGFIGARVFTGKNGTIDLPRLADDADEYGFLVTATAFSGWGAGYKTGVFWSRWRRFLGQMIDSCVNHPSIVCWGLSNEFGTVYGGNNNATNEVRQGEVGEWVGRKDPTRPWVCHGEIELRGHGKEGPMPIRSYHYPFDVAGGVLPHCGRWYAGGLNPWQGSFTNDKPVSVSEDLFHGFQDSNAAMAKSKVGDRIYTLDGYVEAMRYALRSYCEGYYLGGLAAWNPWCFYEMQPKNLLFENGKSSPISTHLLMLKEFPRNVRSGTRVQRTLIAFNRWFSPVEGTLTQSIRMDGRVLSTKTVPISVASSADAVMPIVFTTPTVSSITPMDYIVTWKAADGKALTQETFTFQVVPSLSISDIQLPKGVAAILPNTNSPLWRVRFPGGRYRAVAKALAHKPSFIVLHGTLPISEAQMLDEWSKRGGKILQIEPGKGDWSLVKIAQGDWDYSAFAFRRDDSRMRDIPEAAMCLWEPHGYMGRRPFPKPCTMDARVLWESVHWPGGLQWSDVAWLWRGKGGWLISTIPALERLDVEPVAVHFLRALFEELTNPGANVPWRKAVLVDFAGVDNEGESDAGRLFVQQGANVIRIRPPRDLTKLDMRGTVWVVDAKGSNLTGVAKSFIKAVYRKKGTVLLLDMAKEMDVDWLSFLGITWEDPIPKVMVPNQWGQPSEADTSWRFFTRKENRGVLAGINNEDLFWWDQNDMYRYWSYRFAYRQYPPFKWQGKPGEPVSAYFKSVDGGTTLLTEPGAIGIRHEKGGGAVVFATFSLSKKGYGGDHPDKIYTVIRTVLNNLQAATTKAVEVSQFKFVDLSSLATIGPVWDNIMFGDYRYFPVNQCGWSVVANNFCPVEKFPTEPLCYGDVYFKLIDSARNGGKSILFGPSTYNIKLDKPTKIRRIHFLGWSKWKENPAVLTFGEQNQGVEMKPNIHYGGSCNGGAVKAGQLVYCADWDAVPADRTKEKNYAGTTKMCIYKWTIENPNPRSPIESLKITGANGLAIHALTIEK